MIPGFGARPFIPDMPRSSHPSATVEEPAAGFRGMSICATLLTTAGCNASRQPVSHFALEPSHSPLAKLDPLRESAFRLHLIDHLATEPSELADLLQP